VFRLLELKGRLEGFETRFQQLGALCVVLELLQPGGQEADDEP
jgi:hypothetical protein